MISTRLSAATNLQGFVTATLASWSFMVTITSPSSSLWKTLAPALLRRSRVSGVAVGVVRADLYHGYLRREAPETERGRRGVRAVVGLPSGLLGAPMRINRLWYPGMVSRRAATSSPNCGMMATLVGPYASTNTASIRKEVAFLSCGPFTKEAQTSVKLPIRIRENTPQGASSGGLSRLPVPTPRVGPRLRG